MASSTRDIIERLRTWAAIGRARLRRKPLPPARVDAFEKFDPQCLEADRTEAQARALDRFARTLELDEADIHTLGDDLTPTRPPSAELLAASSEDPTSPGWRVP